MNMRLRLPMALALALGTSHAHALGLGQIEVKSTLNQPLVAEIPVLVSHPGEADALIVRLASPDAFARVGLERPALQAANLSFEVQTDARGRKVIRVTTPGKVSDPFLNFLLEVDWGKGRMLREYTVLLDPPSMAPITASTPPVSRAVAETAAARTEPLPSTPAPAPRPQPSAPASAPAPAPAYVAPASAPVHAAGDTYNVVGGDTLWAIAQRSREEGVTINQMMMALLRANPDAFIGNNINRLKKGAVLRIPGRDETTAVAAAEAAAQVREQMRAWSATVATVAQPADGSGSTAASARPASRRSDSRLELTPPRSSSGDDSASQSGAASEGTGRELRAELARSREEASALAQENVELKSRVGELEALQGDTRRLIELKDSELAAAQRRLAELEAAVTAAGGEVPAAPAPVAAEEPAQAPAETPTEASAETAAETPAETADESTDTTSQSGFESESATETDPAAAVSETAPLSEPAPAPMAAPESRPERPSSFNPLYIGGGAVLLGGLVGLLALRRKKKATDTGLPSVAAGAAAMGYGDTQQEESELVEAIAQYPGDLQLHLDLLRVYAARNDAASFETAAEAMYAQVHDSNDPSWQEAVLLGHQIAPNHPLFSGTGAGNVDAFAQAADSHEAFFGSTSNTAESHEDFFGSASQTQAPAAAQDGDQVPSGEREIDWWFSGGGAAQAADNTPADSAPVAEDKDSDLAAAFDTPAPATDDASLDEISARFAAAFDNIPSDSVGDNPAGLDVDAAATKLELARAYLDMGDAEGARGMLEEVLAEGDANQRNEARQLLGGIG